MSGFVIARYKTENNVIQGAPLYWNERMQFWTSRLNESEKFWWSWAHELVSMHQMKEKNPDCVIEVERR